jgi:hypothetical protein
LKQELIETVYEGKVEFIENLDNGLTINEAAQEAIVQTQETVIESLTIVPEEEKEIIEVPTPSS